jgi:hypothetical protein
MSSKAYSDCYATSWGSMLHRGFEFFSIYLRSCTKAPHRSAYRITIWIGPNAVDGRISFVVV